LTITLPTIDGFTVLFTSTAGDAPEAHSWDFGDGTAGAGPTTTHVYGLIQPFTVTLNVTRTRGFEAAPVSSTATQVVTISAAAQPDESVEDVLNLEVGFHAYEPVRVQDADVGENVSFYNGVPNLPSGQITSLLFFSPSQTIRVRQVTATGTGDGLFRLLLNGQVIDVKRSYATQRNIRFDIEDEIKLTVNDTLEIQVVNTSAASQSYDGALLGRTL
jgi:PKD repeat protein